MESLPQKTLTAPQKTATPPGEGPAPLGPAEGAHAPGRVVSAGGKEYTVEKLIGGGAEAFVYQVTDGTRHYALKLFNPGYHSNAAVMSQVQALNGRGYTVDVLEYGSDYELMAYIPGGSAAQAGLKGNAQAILSIVVKTAMALDLLHKQGILHKDVKPANILLKEAGNWESSVLCDFGIADILEGGTCVSTQVRTPIYAAPELYTDAVTLPEGIFIELTPKADFYSLGMTILSLWLGEGAFKSKENQLALAKTKGRIAVPPDMPDPLAKICRGLLIKDPAKRWDWEEIELSIRGKDVEVDESLIIGDLNITYNASKHQIANTPEQLATFMAQDPDLAVKYLYRGQIEKWLKPYPELVLEIQDIVEKRHPLNQATGLWAAIYLLHPAFPLPLGGYSRQGGEKLVASALTLKDVSDFFNGAYADTDTINLLISGRFVEWVRVRNKALAGSLPNGNGPEVHLLRVQTIDPLSDIDLINDPSNPDYAMTQEGLGRFLNKVYTLYWNKKQKNLTVAQAAVVSSFQYPGRDPYLLAFMDTKGQRFQQQRSWFIYCTDGNSKDNRRKSGPKDDTFRVQSNWMKVIKGYGIDPEYEFSGTGEKVTLLQDLFSHSRKELRKEYQDYGLRGWLSVQHQENPHANLSARFAYEKLLYNYLEDLRRIDDSLHPVQRFDQARGEVDRILSSGKRSIHGLGIRSALQYVFTIVLAVLPALSLLTLIVFAIIEYPTVDTSGLRIESFIWPVGLVVAAIIFFTADSEGCLVPIIGGVVGTAIVFALVKLLGTFILYIYAVLVLGVLVWCSIKTLFFRSTYARDARKFTRPGFDEKVLEPLYFAFNNESSFDSSLNGAFDQDKLDGWRSDLKTRRTWVIIFILVVWLLALFGLLVPRSERFQKVFKMDPQEQVQAPQPVLLDTESLEPGSKGELVVTLQQFLKDAGYLSGQADGSYGPGTRKAVSKFQRDVGLPATGVADSETIKAINSMAQTNTQ